MRDALSANLRRSLFPFALMILGAGACKKADPIPQPPPASLRFIFSADEHGWIDPVKDKEKGLLLGGALNFAEDIRKEGLGKAHVALMSAGDNWTGPFVSTLLQGDPMVKLMNAMGYRASAIGNHEFDFKTNILTERTQQAHFAMLGANIVDTQTKARPSFAKATHLLKMKDHIVGVIGISTTETPTTTDPKNVEGLTFTGYEETLTRESKALREQGADTLVVLMHEGLEGAKHLAPLLRSLDIHIVALGHSHQTQFFRDEGAQNTPRDDVVFCNSGPYWRSFCKVDIHYEQNGNFARVDTEIKEVTRPLPESSDAPTQVSASDATLKAIIDEANANAAGRGDEVLAKAPRGIPERYDTLGGVITDAWLAQFTKAQVAVTNRGGIRQSIEPGDVKVRDVVSALPFSNYLVIVDITGEKLKEVLSSKASIYSGVSVRKRGRGRRRKIVKMTLSDGTVVKADGVYRVIVNSFMFNGGDGYTLKEDAIAVEETGLNWREPVFRSLREMKEFKYRGRRRR